jgi:hypothetical protein
MLKSTSIKADEEVIAAFDRMYGKAVDRNTGLTKGAFFAQMVNSYANPTTTIKEVENPLQAAENEALKTQVANLESEVTDYLNDNAQTVQFITSLRQTLNLDADVDTTGDAIIAEIKATQQRAMNALISQRPLQEDEILFSIPQPHLALLQETAKRLSTDTVTVSIKDILLDMFLRYTVEQFSEWFYPFQINGDTDFKKVTGHTQKELKQWLKK